MAFIGGGEKNYKIVQGFIVFPWTDEREELCEYILRSDREFADRITHLLSMVNVEHTYERDHMKPFNFFNIPRIRNYLRLERKIIYFNTMLGRIWRDHEELEDLVMRR